MSRDGETFAYTVWPAQGERVKPRAVIVAVHGLSGAASDFAPLGIDAARQGMVTYAYELRGQGNDPVRKRRGDIQHPRLWLADLADFTRLVRQRHPEAPLFYYGESMGALIVLHAASTTQANIDGVIFASPVVRVKHPLSWWRTLLLRVMTRVAPDYRISWNENEAESPRLTRDIAYQQWLRQAPHTITRFTLRLLGHLGRLMQRSHDMASQLNLPVLVLYAGQDAFVAPDAVEHFYQHIASRDKTKSFYPESYHLLLHDDDKAQVLNTIGAWLRQRAISR